MHTDFCIIPPNSFALARTVEYFKIPRNVLTVCLGKSTYARCGIIVNVTPFEPEWEEEQVYYFCPNKPWLSLSEVSALDDELGDILRVLGN